MQDRITKQRSSAHPTVQKRSWFSQIASFDARPLLNFLDTYSDMDPANYSPSIEGILESIGGFSWFQLWAMIVIISPEMIASMIAMSPVLTGSDDVFFYCDYIEDYNATSTITGHPTLIAAKNIDSDPFEFCGANGILRPYGDPISIVQEWFLIGPYTWVSDLLTSVQMMGSMLGALISSQVAERVGRKQTHFSLCLLMGVSGCLSAIAPSPYFFAVSRFFAGFAVGGCYVVYMNYLMEFLTPSYRTICGCVSLWAVGEMVLAILAYKIRDWRILMTLTSLPIFLIFIAWPWFPESPRWLLCKQRTDEAVSVFETIASWNRRGHKGSGHLQMVKTVQNSIQASHYTSSSSSIDELKKLLRQGGFRVQLAILTLCWFTCQLIYYGLSFNTKYLSGDPYRNVFYMGLLDLPGSFTGILFNNRFKRKTVFLLFMALASFITLFLVLVDLEVLSLSGYLLNPLSLSLAARYFISAAFAIIACLTAESFPTTVRVACMGICALCGNIGSVLAPQFAYIGTLRKSVHFLSFGGLSAFTFLVSFKLKDRTGQPLEDIVIQHEDENSPINKYQPA